MNVGTEEHKGRAELHEAHDLLAVDAAGQYDFVGFVEGSDIPSARVDVIVTDGFTGNVALKTGEGTAKLIGEFMRESFTRNIASKLAALLSMGVLRHLQRRIDPRRANGGVFLGLNGTVVKSHGGSDAVAFAAAVALAHRLSRGAFLARLASRVSTGQSDASGGEAEARA